MCGAVCEMLQGMEGGWVVIEASHMMGYGLNVTFNMLMAASARTQTVVNSSDYIYIYIYIYIYTHTYVCFIGTASMDYSG